MKHVLLLSLILVAAGCQLASATSSQAKPPVATKPAAPVDRTQELPSVSLKRYEGLKLDMSYNQVCALLGGPGTDKASKDLGGVSTTSYYWPCKGNTGISAMFQHDTLIAKSETNLKKFSLK